MNQIFIQGVGFLALFFVALAPQFNKRNLLLLSIIIGLVLFVVHYSLLHAWTGAIMNAIEAAVTFVSYQKDTKAWAKQKYWPYIFILSYLIVGVLTGVSVVNFLPIIAQSIAAIAVWQTKPQRIRLLSLPPRPLWFIYNFVVGSYAGMVTELFITGSIITGLIRFNSKDKFSKK